MSLIVQACLRASAGMLCLCELSVLSAAELKPPLADQIIAFSNNPNFQYNSGDIYQELSRKQFLEFLQRGQPISTKLPANDPRWKGHVTFHKPLLSWERDEIKAEITGGGMGESLLRCQGAAATRKIIYFWELFNDQVLWIGNEQGDECFLRID